jgi:tyrosine-protein phosphatase SIW14
LEVPIRGRNGEDAVTDADNMPALTDGLPSQTNASPRRTRPGICLCWMLGLFIASLLTVAPFFYYRYSYTYGKRLREVAAGKFYRSGCMTVPGFREAIKRYGIRTIINLMDEWPDPDLSCGYFGGGRLKESELCKELNVKFVFLPVDTISRNDVPGKRPETIEKFLEIMDNPANHPVLLHCKAGLHRTGCLAAVYRMEYDGWTPAEALRELKRMGFGEFVSSSANDYILEYVMTYQRGLRHGRNTFAESRRIGESHTQENTDKER